jgi:hypothetical protein
MAMNKIMKAVVAGMGAGAKTVVVEKPRPDAGASREKHVCMTYWGR